MSLKMDGLMAISFLMVACVSNINSLNAEKINPSDSNHFEGRKSSLNDTGYNSPKWYAGYTLAWSDEFNNSTLDTNHWKYDIGNGPSGWGNNELQYYTNRPENFYLADGKLIIEARKEKMKGFDYTSAKITTQGKKQFQYGRIDIRAKLPKGKGIWPALWMLGSNITEVGWPACGEIDIMELLGHEPSKVYGTVYYDPVSHKYKTLSYTLSNGSFHDNFHVFSLIWEKDSIRILVDDHLELEYDNLHNGSHYPFNAPFYFIMNVAVGGNWPGNPDSTTVFPQRMYVDYIRVFQKK